MTPVKLVLPFSVVSLVHEEFRTGDEIEMRLMRRQRGSLFAMPVSSYTPGIEGKHPRMNQDMKSYSKLLTMAPQDVCNVVIQRERNELLVLYRYNLHMIHEGAMPITSYRGLNFVPQ